MADQLKAIIFDVGGSMAAIELAGHLVSLDGQR